MRIILPFKKEVIFDNNISDITSISLEDELKIVDNFVDGNFLITGEYTVSKATDSVLPFEYNLPVNIGLDDIYDTSVSECYVDDFYYEIINDKKLGISIDIAVDKLKEQINNSDRIIDIIEEENIEKNDTSDNIKLENEDINSKEDIKEEKNNMNSNENFKEEKGEIRTLFNTNYDDQYKTYLVYIIRENDSVDSILDKYDISIDNLKEYNDISDLKLGDKIIIPSK